MSNFSSGRPSRLKSSRYLKGRESNSPTYIIINSVKAAANPTKVYGQDHIKTNQFQPS